LLSAGKREGRLPQPILDLVPQIGGAQARFDELTTEGIPERSSMVGLRICRTRCGAISPSTIAQAIPSGTPTASAPTVTAADPTIMSAMPYRPRVGRQSVDKKFPSPTLAISGAPSRTMKNAIAAKMAMLLSANSCRPRSATLSGTRTLTSLQAAGALRGV
jgi:hypothetical protein